MRPWTATYAWLSREPRTLIQWSIFLVAVLTFNFVWDMAWSKVFDAVAPHALPDATSASIRTWLKEFLGSVVEAPIVEELQSRALPLWLTVKFLPPWALIPVCVVSSVEFGLGHTKYGALTGLLWQTFIALDINALKDAWNLVLSFDWSVLDGLWFQGVGGLTLCIAYLKCGGMRCAFLKPYLSVVLIHATINGI